LGGAHRVKEEKAEVKLRGQIPRKGLKGGIGCKICLVLPMAKGKTEQREVISGGKLRGCSLELLGREEKKQTVQEGMGN